MKGLIFIPQCLLIHYIYKRPKQMALFYWRYLFAFTRSMWDSKSTLECNQSNITTSGLFARTVIITLVSSKADSPPFFMGLNLLLVMGWWRPRKICTNNSTSEYSPSNCYLNWSCLRNRDLFIQRSVLTTVSLDLSPQPVLCSAVGLVLVSKWC